MKFVILTDTHFVARGRRIYGLDPAERLDSVGVRLDPGAVVPRHSHPNEEFGQVVEGALTLEVMSGDETEQGCLGDKAWK